MIDKPRSEEYNMPMSVIMKAGLTVVKVFIGWSGKTGGKIAPILGNWLTQMFDNHINVVVSTVEVWGRQLPSLKKTMSAADCGLLCVTENNANSSLFAFLAENALNCELLLFSVDASRLSAPLRSLQSISFGCDGMRELTRKFNDLLGEDALPAEELERRFPARYPTLEMLIQYTLSESEPQTREDWERNELNEISAQLAELKVQADECKTQIDVLKKEVIRRRREFSEIEPQTPEEEKLKEQGFKTLDALSARLAKLTTQVAEATAQNAELTKRAERLKAKLPDANPTRKDSRAMTREAGYAQ